MLFARQLSLLWNCWLSKVLPGSSSASRQSAQYFLRRRSPVMRISGDVKVEDLRDLCRELNQRAAKYLVVGGFAMRAANYIRKTMDVDLIVAADPENEA